MAQDKQLTIRSSSAEFLIFERQVQEDGIEVHYEDETLGITQKMMAALFDVEATTGNSRVVQTEDSRQVSRNIDHYNLDAIISVGYRANNVAEFK